MANITLPIPNANTLINLWETNDLVKSSVGPSINDLIIYIRVNNLEFTTDPINIMPKDIIDLIKNAIPTGPIETINHVSSLVIGGNASKYLFPMMYQEYVKSDTDIDVDTLVRTGGTLLIMNFINEYKIPLKTLQSDKLTKFVNTLISNVDLAKFIEDYDIPLFRDDLPTFDLEKLRACKHKILYKITNSDLYKPTANKIIAEYFSVKGLLKSLIEIKNTPYEWVESSDIHTKLFRNSQITSWVDLAYMLYFDPETSPEWKKYLCETVCYPAYENSMFALLNSNSSDDIEKHLYDLLKKYNIPLKNTVINDEMDLYRYMIQRNYYSKECIAKIKKLYEQTPLPLIPIPASSSAPSERPPTPNETRLALIRKLTNQLSPEYKTKVKYTIIKKLISGTEIPPDWSL